MALVSELLLEFFVRSCHSLRPLIWYAVFILQVLMCGLLGLPPSHGVIPQSPMHTKALVTLKKEVRI